ncbi:MAG TPA: DUF4126 domain-containing protein [Solirubrobacteraceae bacterium]|jgi:hypothetical protein|nr:DUF4126 domain-containing protein [Solirubrobacteraceae bacterium]
MHGIVFDIGLGAGLAAACGMRPFLPLLLAGTLGSAGALDVAFAHEGFGFLQEGWWLLAVTVALVVSYALQVLLDVAPMAERGSPRSHAGRPALGLSASALAGIAYGGGALLFAGTLAAHRDAWWPGIVAGLAAAWLADRVVGPIVFRARARLSDRAAREALTVYLDAAALAAAGLVCLLHPLGYVLLAVLVWFLARVRARARDKYAGLRVLRR